MALSGNYVTKKNSLVYVILRGLKKIIFKLIIKSIQEKKRKHPKIFEMNPNHMKDIWCCIYELWKFFSSLIMPNCSDFSVDEEVGT